MRLAIGVFEQPAGLLTKLLVRQSGLVVKVEVNCVMRGTVFPVRSGSMSVKACDVLMADLELPLAPVEDLYGSKLVAALDRQHPRDLFDVMHLFAHGGITPGIRRAFVVYLACHNRPVHEVLFPVFRDISQDYERTFKGMTAETVELDELLAARAWLVESLPNALDADERAFLLSLVRNDPRWDLLGIEHLRELPGMRWKCGTWNCWPSAVLKNFSSRTKPLQSAWQGLNHGRLVGEPVKDGESVNPLVGESVSRLVGESVKDGESVSRCKRMLGCWN